MKLLADTSLTRYAGGTVLIIDAESKQQKHLRKVEMKSEKKGPNINNKKTEYSHVICLVSSAKETAQDAN